MIALDDNSQLSKNMIINIVNELYYNFKVYTKIRY